jgi:hypothetical protein
MMTQTSLNLVTRELVPEDQRMAITERIFGLRFSMELEPVIYNFTGRLSEDYKGGYWDFYTLSNGGFYLSLADERTYHVVSDNLFEGDLSSDALSITACLYAYSHLSFIGTVAFSDTYADMYHKLRQFTLDHQEIRKILSATD